RALRQVAAPQQGIGVQVGDQKPGMHVGGQRRGGIGRRLQHRVEAGADEGRQDEEEDAGGRRNQQQGGPADPFQGAAHMPAAVSACALSAMSLIGTSAATPQGCDSPLPDVFHTLVARGRAEPARKSASASNLYWNTTASDISAICSVCRFVQKKPDSTRKRTH